MRGAGRFVQEECEFRCRGRRMRETVGHCWSISVVQARIYTYQYTEHRGSYVRELGGPVAQTLRRIHPKTSQVLKPSVIQLGRPARVNDPPESDLRACTHRLGAKKTMKPKGGSSIEFFLTHGLGRLNVPEGLGCSAFSLDRAIG